MCPKSRIQSCVWWKADPTPSSWCWMVLYASPGIILQKQCKSREKIRNLNMKGSLLKHFSCPDVRWAILFFMVHAKGVSTQPRCSPAVCGIKGAFKKREKGRNRGKRKRKHKEKGRGKSRAGLPPLPALYELNKKRNKTKTIRME